MRLGLPLFILPFIFVYDPALIMVGSVMNIVERISLTLIAIWAITSAFESWIYGVGQIGLASRVLFLVGGLLIIVPVFIFGLVGAALLIAVVAVNLILRRGKNAVSL